MISVGFKTDTGQIRDGNEDSLFVLPKEHIYIVADGVGGHNSGELASRMAVGYMAQYVALNPVDAVESSFELRKYFTSVFEGANELIFSKSNSENGNRGMATTCVLCYVLEDTAYVVNIGDSRAYLVRDGVLRQITEDHTAVHEMIKRGLITEDDAMLRPDRNMITKALGGEAAVAPDFFSFKVYGGDILILCTDGLYGEISAERMTELASGSDTMHKLAKDLVDEANRNGGRDNISVVCVKIH